MDSNNGDVNNYINDEDQDERENVKSATQILLENDYVRLQSSSFTLSDGLRYESFPVAFFEIVTLLAKDCEDNVTDISLPWNRLFVEGYSEEMGKQCEIMLRFASKEQGIIVARVQFAHERKGKMTMLYQILKSIAEKYGYRRVMIESVVTEEMENWCKKNGLVRIQGGYHIDPNDLAPGEHLYEGYDNIISKYT